MPIITIQPIRPQGSGSTIGDIASSVAGFVRDPRGFASSLLAGSATNQNGQFGFRFDTDSQRFIELIPPPNSRFSSPRYTATGQGARIVGDYLEQLNAFIVGGARPSAEQLGAAIGFAENVYVDSILNPRPAPEVKPPPDDESPPIKDFVTDGTDFVPPDDFNYYPSVPGIPGGGVPLSTRVLPVGFSQMTPAQQLLVRSAMMSSSPSRSRASANGPKRKRRRTSKKRSVKRRTKRSVGVRRKATRLTLKKGSAAAKRHMARLRAMQKRKRGR